MTDLFDVRGIVPVFDRASLGISDALLLSPDDTYTIRIEKRMRPYILACMEALRQREIYQANDDDIAEFEYIVEKTILDILREEDMVLTQEEMITAVCEGVKCASVDIGTTLASGINSSIKDTIAIDENGNLVVDDGQGAGAGASTLLEQKNGSAEQVLDGINAYLADMESWYSSYSLDTDTWLLFAESKYEVETVAMQDAITYYNSYRGGAGLAPQPIDSALTEYLYCRGITPQKTNVFVIDNHAEPVTILNMIEPLQSPQYTIWIEAGKLKPRTDYTLYACTIRASESIVVPASVVNGNTLLTHITNLGRESSSSLIRITMSGSLTIPAEPDVSLDLLWFNPPSNTLDDLPFAQRHFSYNGANSFSMTPTTLPAYSPTGDYSYILEVPANTPALNKVEIRDNNAVLNAYRGQFVGQITVTLEDLGQG